MMCSSAVKFPAAHWLLYISTQTDAWQSGYHVLGCWTLKWTPQPTYPSTQLASTGGMQPSAHKRTEFRGGQSSKLETEPHISVFLTILEAPQVKHFYNP